MKKTAHLMLLLGMAGLFAANAQTETTATNQPADLTGTPTNLVEAAAVATVVDTNTAAVDTTLATTNGVLAEATSTNAPAGTNTIPLIQFTDLPITSAIENLARQAGINYMLDPKIGYGQADASGQIKAEPQLSIRWENISAESALLALLDNYGLQLVHDKRTGIDRITTKDPTAPPVLITRVIQLQYASVAGMNESIQSVLTDKRSKVMADNRTSQMVVVATDPEQTAVDTLVKQLDRPTKQVLIETKLVEISSQPSTRKNVDWSPTLSAQTVKIGNNGLPGLPPSSTPIFDQSGLNVIGNNVSPGTVGGILGDPGLLANTASGFNPATYFLNADGVKAVISFLNATYDAQIMSTPHIVTLDNEPADISVTRQFPIVNFGGGTQNSSGSSSVTYSNVGTILHVTPRISANEKISLKVTPEVSSHFGDVSVTIPGGSGNASFTLPFRICDSPARTTQVLIPNGNTLVMGGLVQDNPTASYTKVPFMGDIPGLGWAFRSETKSMSKDTLIIFLTPTIVQDSDFTPNKSDFLQTQPHTMKMPMNPNTMWDSGAARGNWSNPAPSPGEFDSNDKLKNF